MPTNDELYADYESAVTACCAAGPLEGAAAGPFVTRILDALKALLENVNANLTEAEWTEIIARATAFIAAPSVIGGLLLLGYVVRAIKSPAQTPGVV